MDGVGSLDIGYVLLDSSPEPAEDWTPGGPRPVPDGEPAGAERIPSLFVRGARSGLDVALHPKRLC